MNETIQSILARRSMREGFTGEHIDREELQLIARAGLSAPSSKNAEPWRLHVVSNRTDLAWVADQVVAADGVDTYVPHDPLTGQPYPEWTSTVLESAEVLRSASAAIFVVNSGRFSRGRAVLGSAPRSALRSAIVGYGLEMVGIGAAVENMMLAASSLGRGCAFMGDVAIAEDAIVERFPFEGDLIGVLALGTVAIDAPALPQRRINDHLVIWH